MNQLNLNSSKDDSVKLPQIQPKKSISKYSEVMQSHQGFSHSREPQTGGSQLNTMEKLKNQALLDLRAQNLSSRENSINSANVQVSMSKSKMSLESSDASQKSSIKIKRSNLNVMKKSHFQIGSQTNNQRMNSPESEEIMSGIKTPQRARSKIVIKKPKHRGSVLNVSKE